MDIVKNLATCQHSVIHLPAPQIPGSFFYDLYVRSDSYVQCTDHNLTIRIDVSPKPVAPENKESGIFSVFPISLHYSLHFACVRFPLWTFSRQCWRGCWKTAPCRCFQVSPQSTKGWREKFIARCLQIWSVCPFSLPVRDLFLVLLHSSWCFHFLSCLFRSHCGRYHKQTWIRWRRRGGDQTSEWRPCEKEAQEEETQKQIFCLRGDQSGWE